MTTQALTNCGGWIEGTTIPIPYNAPYMIVVSGQLDAILIERALRQISGCGKLEAGSKALEIG